MMAYVLKKSIGFAVKRVLQEIMTATMSEFNFLLPIINVSDYGITSCRSEIFYSL